MSRITQWFPIKTQIILTIHVFEWLNGHLPVYKSYEHEDFFNCMFMMDYVVYLGNPIKDICVSKMTMHFKVIKKTKNKDRLRLV